MHEKNYGYYCSYIVLNSSEMQFYCKYTYTGIIKVEHFLKYIIIWCFPSYITLYMLSFFGMGEPMKVWLVVYAN